MTQRRKHFLIFFRSRKYSLIFVLLLNAITALVGITLYNSLYQAEIQQIQNFYNIYLENKGTSFDKNIKDIITNAASVINSSALEKCFLLSEDSITENSNLTRTQLRQSQTEVKRFKITHSDLDAANLFLFDPDIAISDRGIYRNIENFPGKYYFEEIKTLRTSDIIQPAISVQEKPRNVLMEKNPYMFLNITIPVNTGIRRGSFLLNLKSTVLYRLIQSIDLYLKGITAIISEESLVVAQSEGAAFETVLSAPGMFSKNRIETIQWNGKTFVRFLISNRYNLSLVHLVSYNEIYSSILVLRNTFIIQWILLLIISLPLAAILEKWTATPYNRLKSFLKEKQFIQNSGDSPEELESIMQNFEILMEDSSFYKSKMEAYQPVLDELALFHFLDRTENLTPAIATRFKEILSTLIADHYKCILIRIDGYKNYKANNTLKKIQQDLHIIGQMITGVIPLSKTIYHIQEGMIIVILNYTDDPESLTTLKKGICEVTERVTSQLNQPLTIAEGMEVADINALPQSFSTAQTALEYKFLTEETYLRFADLPDFPERSGIKKELLKELRQAIRHLEENRSKDLADTVLNTIYLQDNVKLSFLAGCSILINELRPLQTEIDIHLPSAGELGSLINSFELLTELREYFYTLLEEIISLLRFSKRQESISIVGEINTWLSKNYSDSLLQIADIAKHFKLSPTYFGRFFHEIMGASFTNYVNDMRIQKAETLLLSSEQTVNEIAKTVGFNSTQYFIRTFKKKNRITPSRFRVDNESEHKTPTG